MWDLGYNISYIGDSSCLRFSKFEHCKLSLKVQEFKGTKIFVLTEQEAQSPDDQHLVSIKHLKPLMVK